jgi:hypothetical protein
VAPDRRWVALALAAVLAACGGGPDEQAAVTDGVDAPAPAATPAAPAALTPEQRALAAADSARRAQEAVDAAAQAAAQGQQATTLAASKAAADSAARGASAQPEEDVLRESFTYAGGARDPFASLINAKSTGPELVDLQLVGIYQDVRSNANSVAIVREKKDGKRHKLRTGDQIGRLRVAQIRAKDVVFTVEDFGFERQETLSLRKQEDVTP